ncbi:hypothetical protein EOL70_06725 [Leucothrix sargassi]|nr:hypothetical protein EOL70_06725 [Leucothrix sargassi]
MKKHHTYSATALLGALALSAGAAYAHHGSNGQFDMAQSLEVSGTVTRIRMVNPHSYVYFDVQNSEGKTDKWRCELRSGNLLKRSGWTKDMFAKGTKISITGTPARNEEHACYTKTITFEDGTTIARNDKLDADGQVVLPPRETTLADGKTPNIEGNWAAERRKRPARGQGGGPRPERGAASAENGERPAPPPRRGGGRQQVERTEAGKQAVAGFVREDNPRFACQPTNIFIDFWFDQMVNKIEQTEDKITITYGFMNIVRMIHLDMDKHPENITPSIAGHSIGQWEDGVLTVDTIGFKEGFLHVTPRAEETAKHSTELHVVEKFTLSEDGRTLSRTYEATDPLYLVGKYTGQDSVKLTTADYEDYSCEDLTGDTF